MNTSISDIPVRRTTDADSLSAEPAATIEFTPVADGLLLPEGPVAMADGSVLLVEVVRGTISRVSAAGAVSVLAELGGGPNGLAIGPDGALYVCNNGGGLRARSGEGMLHIEFAPELYRGGAIERLDLKSGAVTTLYTACDGRPLLAPNDLVFDRQGGLWFTDYGRATATGRDFGGIYYCQPDGSRIVCCLDHQISPNGIGLNAAEDRLYWADSMTARVVVCEIASPGFLAPPPSPFQVGLAAYTLPGFQQLDSLALEANDNVCAATVINGGITVIEATGAMTHYPIADPLVTNICFGGLDLRDVWITAGLTGRLYRARWPRPGLRLAFNA
jgi:gluconolactonase